MLAIACLLLFGRSGAINARAAADSGRSLRCDRRVQTGCVAWLQSIFYLEVRKQVGESPKLWKKGAIAQGGF
jgi:hypothetical protein